MEEPPQPPNSDPLPRCHHDRPESRSWPRGRGTSARLPRGRFHVVTTTGEQTDRRLEVLADHVRVPLRGRQVQVPGEGLHGWRCGSASEELGHEEVTEIVEAESAEAGLLLARRNA